MIDWNKVEGLILSKIGVFSYWYFGLHNYIGFLLFFSLCLNAVYIYCRGRENGKIIGFGRISLIVYGTVILAWGGVGLLDMVVHFYVQSSIPEENVLARLSFLARPEIAVMENLIRFCLTLLLPIVFLLRDRGMQALSVIPTQHIGVKKGLALYILYLCAILTSFYLGSLVFGVPMRKVYFTLVSGFSAIKNCSAILSLVYLVIMVLIISLSKELLFRGIIYPFFRERVGFIFGLLGQTVMFSLFQQKFDMFPIYFILGVFLTVLYEQTKSIYLPVAVHGSLLMLGSILQLRTSIG